VRNALIECCVVHARNLSHFFYARTPGRTPRKDDILVDDFFDCEAAWGRTDPPKITQVLLDAYENGGRGAKECVHLTYARLQVSDEEKVWDLQAMRDGIVKVWEHFRNTTRAIELSRSSMSVDTGLAWSSGGDGAPGQKEEDFGGALA